MSQMMQLKNFFGTMWGIGCTKYEKSVTNFWWYPFCLCLLSSNAVAGEELKVGSKFTLSKQSGGKYAGCEVVLKEWDLRQARWVVHVPEHECDVALSREQILVLSLNKKKACLEGVVQSFVPDDLWTIKNPQYGEDIERMVAEFWVEHSFPHPMNRAVYLNDADGNPQQHRVRLVKHGDRQKAHEAFRKE